MKVGVRVGVRVRVRVGVGVRVRTEVGEPLIDSPSATLPPPPPPPSPLSAVGGARCMEVHSSYEPR